MSTMMKRVCHHAHLGDQLLRILMENPCRAPQGEWNVGFHLDIVKYYRQWTRGITQLIPAVQ